MLTFRCVPGIQGHIIKLVSLLQMGLEKLYFAEGQVTVMKSELVALQPILIKTAEDTAKLLKQIDADTKDAQATRSNVEAEEAVANVKAEEAKAIKDDCEAELAVVSSTSRIKSKLHESKIYYATSILPAQNSDDFRSNEQLSLTGVIRL